MTDYFLDTYALIEIIKGNSKYAKYLKSKLHTSIFNLYELYYNLIREFDEDTAKKYFIQFKQILIRFTDEDIFQASQFKLKHSAQKLSYTDCIGYAISISYNLKFLTGDKEFKYLDNVKFVTK